MSGPWSPALRVYERGDRCRLSLGGRAWGDGRTLQEAADDLVARLLRTAMGLRSGTPATFPAELGPVDLRWLEFVHELGDIAAAGGDVRPRIFGVR